MILPSYLPLPPHHPNPAVSGLSLFPQAKEPGANPRQQPWLQFAGPRGRGDRQQQGPGRKPGSSDLTVPIEPNRNPVPTRPLNSNWVLATLTSDPNPNIPPIKLFPGPNVSPQTGPFVFLSPDPSSLLSSLCCPVEGPLGLARGQEDPPTAPSYLSTLP